MQQVLDFLSFFNITIVVYIIYIVLIAGTVIVVISENRTPVKSIAWLVVLIFVPIVGLVIYYFFGQDTRRMRHISAKKYKEIKDLSFKSLIDNRNVKILPEYTNLINLLKNNNLSPVLQGSKIEILTEGSEMLDVMLRDISEAKYHIHIEFFIFKNDSTGKRVKELLMKKAAEGVEVRFMYDNVANWLVPKKFYHEMKKSGVQVTSLMKVRFPKFAKRVNYRNIPI